MFTGLVETIGTVLALAPNASPSSHSGEVAATAQRIVLEAASIAADVAVGDSVALNGCCLTVVPNEPAQPGTNLSFDAAAETLKVTTLGRLRLGQRVNLERAVRLGDRLGGHLVLGHVDGIGDVRAWRSVGTSRYLTVALPPELARFVAQRGSITIDGVSLTVTEVVDGAHGAATAQVNLIPHTLAHTTLQHLAVGDGVNLEVDMVARYLARLMLSPTTTTQQQGASL